MKKSIKSRAAIYTAIIIAIAGILSTVVFTLCLIFMATGMSSIWLAILFTIIAIAICAAAGGCIIYRLIRCELEPIGQIMDTMQHANEGDFSHRLDFSMSQNELGELQNAVSNFVGILSAVTEDERYILGEIAQGNLTTEDMEDMPGEFAEIAESVNAIKSAMTTLVKDMEYTAIELQDTAMGFSPQMSAEQLLVMSEELSAIAAELMEKAGSYTTS